MTTLPYAIEVTPDTELEFTLSRSLDDPAKCIMTLRHPGSTDEHLAYKVSADLSVYPLVLLLRILKYCLRFYR